MARTEPPLTQAFVAEMSRRLHGAGRGAEPAAVVDRAASRRGGAVDRPARAEFASPAARSTASRSSNSHREPALARRARLARLRRSRERSRCDSARPGPGRRLCAHGLRHARRLSPRGRAFRPAYSIDSESEVAQAARRPCAAASADGTRDGRAARSTYWLPPGRCRAYALAASLRTPASADGAAGEMAQRRLPFPVYCTGRRRAARLAAAVPLLHVLWTVPSCRPGCRLWSRRSARWLRSVNPRFGSSIVSRFLWSHRSRCRAWISRKGIPADARRSSSCRCLIGSVQAREEADVARRSARNPLIWPIATTTSCFVLLSDFPDADAEHRAGRRGRARRRRRCDPNELNQASCRRRISFCCTARALGTTASGSGWAANAKRGKLGGLSMRCCAADGRRCVQPHRRRSVAARTACAT